MKRETLDKLSNCLNEKEDVKVFKVCWKCGVYFPAKLHSFNCYCPEHQDEYQNTLIPRIKRERYIQAEYLDVYNDIPYFPYGITSEKDKKEYLDQREQWRKQGHSVVSYQIFERVCRSCGTRLLRKDGKYDPRRRDCGKKHEQPVRYYNWGATKDVYLYELWEKQGERYKYFYESSNFWKASIPERKRVIKCEDCGKDFRFHQINVHHVIEVNQLTAENIMLIWDFDNLLALCYNCHYKKRHGWLDHDERKEKIRLDKIKKRKKKHVTLDMFFRYQT